MFSLFKTKPENKTMTQDNLTVSPNESPALPDGSSAASLAPTEVTLESLALEVQQLRAENADFARKFAVIAATFNNLGL